MSVAVANSAKRARFIWAAVFGIAMALAGGIINSVHLGTWGSLAVAVALIFLFIGIHNAWDSIAYHVLVNRPNTKE